MHLIVDTKAKDIRILDLNGIVSYCSHFILCTANSARQVQAIADNVMLNLKNEHEMLPLGVEGKQNNSWILIDYDEVIVHVFNDEARDYYTLDSLWMNAPLIPLETYGIDQEVLKANENQNDEEDSESDSDFWD